MILTQPYALLAQQYQHSIICKEQFVRHLVTRVTIQTEQMFVQSVQLDIIVRLVLKQTSAQHAQAHADSIQVTTLVLTAQLFWGYWASQAISSTQPPLQTLVQCVIQLVTGAQLHQLTASLVQRENSELL